MSLIIGFSCVQNCASASRAAWVFLVISQIYFRAVLMSTTNPVGRIQGTRLGSRYGVYSSMQLVQGVYCRLTHYTVDIPSQCRVWTLSDQNSF